MTKLKKACFDFLVKTQQVPFVKRSFRYAASRFKTLAEASTMEERKQANEIKRNIFVSSINRPLSSFIQENKESMYTYLQSFHFENEPVKEMEGYLNHAFRRFLYTLDLIPAGAGNLLEIGAGPYFMTLLLDKYTKYTLNLTNHYGDDTSNKTLVDVKYDNEKNRKEFVYKKVNLETDDLPFPDHHFDVVLFCEVIEHLPQDALIALQRIRKVLKPGGCLILTTPNVGRLENVMRIIDGENIYDPYSGYGIYGRHNREFTPEELSSLLNHAGFDVECRFTSNVTDSYILHHVQPLKDLMQRLQARAENLGEYIFIRAKNNGKPVSVKKPRWLYRSYPESELGS